MHKNMLQKLGWLVIMATLIVSLGCSFAVNVPATAPVGELRHETQTVELGEAQTVRVTVAMGAGELTVRGGTQALLEADFTYNVADWKPQVDYTIVNDQGRLDVRQPDSQQLTWGNQVRNEWDLRFSETVPLDMTINLGAGDSNLDLDTLNLITLEVNGGAGDTTIDLSGNQSLSRMRFNMGVGDATIDLRGNRRKDLNLDIKGGVGQITLHLPSEIGVRVEVTSGVGDIQASGLHHDGSAYVNDAYGKAETTLFITIEAGVGEITLDVAEE